jgi:peptidoglycan/LPS O-acetylase OafA/YrhL
VFVYVPDATTLQAKFTTINAVYWTLAIEVQFYLVVTAALAFRRLFYPFLLLITALSVPSLLLPSSDLIGIFFPYWPMFATGIGLYWLFERGLSPSQLLRQRLWWVPWTAGLGLMAAFILYLGLGGRISHLGFAILFGVCLYLAESLDRYLTERVRSPERCAIRVVFALALALGAMSYSLYLLHGRLQFLSMQALRQVLPTNSIVFDAALIIVTCGMCYVFYLLCERPFMSTRLRALTERTAPDSRPTITANTSRITPKRARQPTAAADSGSGHVELSAGGPCG